jgi:AcrR family transcriptional regulator
VIKYPKGDENMGFMTFKNLSKEKQERILEAAQKEFSRVPFSQTLISNIVSDAKIPRGSFYQYFDDPAQLFSILLFHLYGKEAKPLSVYLERHAFDLLSSLKAKFADTLGKIQEQNRDFFISNILAVMLKDPGLAMPPLFSPKIDPEARAIMTKQIKNEKPQEMIALTEKLTSLCLFGYLASPLDQASAKNEYNRYLDLMYATSDLPRRKNEITANVI